MEKSRVGSASGVEDLYHLSLAIGSGSDLTTMVEKFLQVLLQRWQGHAAVVLTPGQHSELSGGETLWQPLAQIPRSLTQKRGFRALAARVSWNALAQALAEGPDAGFRIMPALGDSIFVLGLPRFGLLVWFRGAEARTLTEAQLAGLGKLAEKLAQLALEHRAHQELQRQAARFALASSAAGLGIWEWDIVGEAISWDERMCRLYQVDADSFTPSLDVWTERVLPADVPALLDALRLLISGANPEPLEFRVIQPDGSVDVHSLHALLVRDENGDPLRVVGTVRDISQEKIAEAQLRWQSDRLALATASAGIGIWYWDLGKNNIEWDARVRQLLDSDADGPFFSFQDFIERIEPADRELVSTHIQRAVATGKIYSTEFRVRHRSGRQVYLQAFGAPVLDLEGHTEGVLGVAYDISERKALVDKLKERVSFETLIAELSRRFVNVLAEDVDGAIMEALQQIGQFGLADRCYVGFFENQEPELNIRQVWSLDEVPDNLPAGTVWPHERLPWLLHALHERDAIHFSSLEEMPAVAVREQALFREYGVVSWLAFPLWSGEVPLGLLVLEGVLSPRHWLQEVRQRLRVVADIFANALERQRNELKLALSAAHQRALLEAIPDQMYRVDRWGRIKDYSLGGGKAKRQLGGLGVAPELITEFLDTAMHPVLLGRINEALKTDKTQLLECDWHFPEQSQVSELRVSPCGKNEVITIVRDISERARLERMRSDFINDASHELRTPITTITMMVELLRGGGEPDEVAEYWRVLRAELDRAHLLIEDLLAWGRLESGRMGIAVEPQDLASIIEKAATSIRPLAESRQITLQVDFADRMPLILGNNYALFQVFVNLLNNAVKFTPDGGEVTVTSVQEDSWLTVCVADSGIGIPAYELPDLFGRFFRASNALEAEIPGSGMGLYLIKGIIDEIGGKISVQSTEGKGSRFTVSLPVTEHGSPQEPG